MLIKLIIELITELIIELITTGVNLTVMNSSHPTREVHHGAGEPIPTGWLPKHLVKC